MKPRTLGAALIAGAALCSGASAHSGAPPPELQAAAIHILAGPHPAGMPRFPGDRSAVVFAWGAWVRLSSGEWDVCGSIHGQTDIFVSMSFLVVVNPDGPSHMFTATDAAPRWGASIADLCARIHDLNGN
jgi:hypothetical protein